MKKNKIDWKIVGLGLICLTAIEITALLNGVDGKLLAAIVGVIALTIGVVIPNPIK